MIESNSPAAPSTTGAAVSLTALYVADLAKSVQFYVDGCGLSRLHDVSTDTFDAVIVGRTDDSGGGIELMRKKVPTGPIEQGTGFAKVVLTVDDVAATTSRAVANGGSVTMAPVVLEQMGGLVLSMVADPDGYTAELIQRSAS